MARPSEVIDLTADDDDASAHWTRGGAPTPYLHAVPVVAPVRESLPPPLPFSTPQPVYFTSLAKHAEGGSSMATTLGQPAARPQLLQGMPTQYPGRVSNTPRTNPVLWQPFHPPFPVRPVTWGRPPHIPSMNDGKIACLNCRHDPSLSVTSCDGELPCSACAEPGLECCYPEDVRPPRALNPLHRSLERNVSHQPVRTAPVPPVQHAEHVSVTPVVPVARTSGSGMVPSAHPALPPPAEPVPEEPWHEGGDLAEDLSLLSINSDSVTALLRKCETQMRAHRELVVQAALQRAKLDALQAPPAMGQTKSTNVFADLIKQSRARKEVKGSSPSITLQIKSHRTGSSKKWTSVVVPVVVASTSAVILPKYKSIGRLGSSILAPNSHILKYLPYFPEVEDFPEEEQKRHADVQKWFESDEDSMQGQRHCLEVALMWRPWLRQALAAMEIQLRDILWVLLFAAPEERKCEECGMKLPKDRYRRLLHGLSRPSDEVVKRAHLMIAAIKHVVQPSLWHTVIEIDLVKQALREPDDTVHLCSICFVHDCLIHGQYLEPEDDNSGSAVFKRGDAAKRGVMINDEERDLNHRRATAASPYPKHPVHHCGLYCVDVETRISHILGYHSSGAVKGVYNRNVSASRSAWSNTAACGSMCFWMVDNRKRFATVLHTQNFAPAISAADLHLLRLRLRLFGSNQRAPCMMARGVAGLTCLDAFHYLLALSQSPSHIEQAQRDHTALKLSKSAAAVDTSNSARLERRAPFFPCSHDGPCQNNPDCTCASEHVHCEWFCACDGSCKRRFPGCSCAKSNKVCFNDNRCECWAHNRECDPWQCKSCGATEVLDPANRYREAIRAGRCKNTKIQLDLPARTIKAPSEVQGWGLYAGENIDALAYVGEYKGETVGNQESDRRGSVYHHLGQEYLFMTNKEQQIDGSNFGNKTRFINNSQRDDYINVYAKKLLCNGVQRIMLYAKRFIAAGDELLYNYNYPEDVVKKFWERGEGPASGPGTIVAKPTIPLQPRLSGTYAKSAASGKVEAEGKSTPRPPVPSPSAVLDSLGRPICRRLPNGRFIPQKQPDAARSETPGKRKRTSDSETNEDEPPDDFDVPDDHGYDPAESTSEETTDPEEPSVADSETESDAVEYRTKPSHRRRVFAHDRRKGGEAQRRAWETRKARMAGQ